MGCRQDANVTVFGDWVQIANQQPPNANQNDRNTAQQSADAAADAAGELHCNEGTGNCPPAQTCKAFAWGMRTYTFEQGQFNNVFYIRCTVNALFRCDCVPPGGGGGGQNGDDEGDGDGNGQDGEQGPTPQQVPTAGVKRKGVVRPKGGARPKRGAKSGRVKT